MAVRKDDWLDSGLTILGQSGLKALTIDYMAGILGVTKGSFYHHFQSMRYFQEQLVACWADQYLGTSGAIPEDPSERLALLDSIMDVVFSQITEPEIAIRTWAQEDELVYSFVAQVDSVRRDFVLSVFTSLASSEAEAQIMADMLFTMTIGSITVLPRLNSARVLELYHEFKKLYGLED
jgi:AcrR family transcriptional regulator